jgi:hypothetical protein
MLTVPRLQPRWAGVIRSAGGSALVATLLATAGCNHADRSAADDGSETNLSESGTMVRRPAVAPPPDVPLATLEHGTRKIPGTVVYRSWLRDGRMVTMEAARPPAGDPSATVPTRAAVNIATSIPPARMDVLLYDDTSPNSTPTGAKRISCKPTAEAVACTFETGDSIRVRAPIGDGVRLMIVNAAWYVPATMRAHDESLPPEVSAAWAFVGGSP